MTKIARILMAAASLLLGAMYLVPLWRIDLIAPQYPEGLGMLIHLDTVTGIQPNDLENINALNHYIGMKRIDPAAIPVLRVMPWVVGALAAGAFLVALVGRRAALVGWLVAFGVAGALGMYEFWWWQYDYGHDLAADAIIKVPGMSYQPPLIGAKQLLNFTAISWPSLGSLAAALAFGCGALALWLSMRRRLPAAVPRSSAVRRVASAGAAAA